MCGPKVTFGQVLMHKHTHLPTITWTGLFKLQAQDDYIQRNI